MNSPKDSRTARLARDEDGDPIGAAVFLTADELAELGVETSTTDAVGITIEDGEVRLLNTTVSEATDGGR